MIIPFNLREKLQCSGGQQNLTTRHSIQPVSSPASTNHGTTAELRVVVDPTYRQNRRFSSHFHLFRLPLQHQAVTIPPWQGREVNMTRFLGTVAILQTLSPPVLSQANTTGAIAATVMNKADRQSIKFVNSVVFDSVESN